MPDAPRRNLRDLLAEAVVVVLSILIAFGLDAWWESHRERQNLDLDLARVLEEVTAPRTAVLTQVASYERIVAGSEALLAKMDANRDAPTVSVPDTLAYLAVLLPTLNPRLSTVEAFLGSGRLATVEDRDLRAALAALPGRMEDAVIPIERQRDVFFSVHQAELGRDFDIAPVIRLVELPHFANGTALRTYEDVRYPNRIPVRNHTRERLAGVRRTLVALGDLAAELRTIEALVTQSLSR